MFDLDNIHLKRLRLSLILFITVVLIGIAGFQLIEGLSFLDAAYFAIVTIATIGYGDFVPVTPIGKIFTMFFIVTGVGMAYYTFSLIVSMTIEGHMKDILGRQGMQKRIANLKNHIIVCGAGKVGINVVAHLLIENENFVVVEKDQEICEKLVDQDVLSIYGDATLDEVLLSAGVHKARGIITALSHDADNVYVALTAKSLNPEIKIVARADRPEAEEKLIRAGATTVIFPSVMGGRRLVSAMTKPVITDFVDNLFYNKELYLDIAEIVVNDSSPLVGKSLLENNIKEKFDSIVVAIKRSEQLITNPRSSEIIQANDIMIVMGHRDPLNALSTIASK